MFIIVYMLSPELVESDNKWRNNQRRKDYTDTHSKTFCMCGHRPYLLDLALLGSQVAHRLLEVPEMTVFFCFHKIHSRITACSANAQQQVLSSNIHTT